MATDGRTLETLASPSRVWNIWSQPSTWAEWNPDVVAASLDGPLAPGTTGTLQTKQMKHRIVIESVEPGKSFALRAAAMPGTSLLFTCTIEPFESGARIGQSVEVSGPLAFAVGKPMAKQIAATFGPLLAALKARAETA